MKPNKISMLSLGCALGLTWAASAQTPPPPAEKDAAPVKETPPPAPPDAKEAPAPAAEAKPPTPAAADAAPAAAPAPPPPPVTPVADGEKGLRLNFRGVPLEMVLNYLSEAAGFIINLETEVRGRVDVWSNQPLTKDEAINLLNTVLSKNGYAAIRNDRTLTIMSRDEAKKKYLPVISGNKPENIPKNDEMVTQIIPVRYISATQLVKDLAQLLPTTAVLTANEGGNALVLTDSQVNIRRVTEIVQALDTAISSVSTVKVFPLQNADARTLATTIASLFPADNSRGGTQGGQAGRFFNMIRGGGPPGMPGGDSGGSSGGGGRAPTPRVVAVADERSNSVVVNAPEEQMAVIEAVIKQVDRNVDDITEIRVFHLKFADPQETADLLSNLFADSSSTSRTGQSGRSQFQFGGGRFGGGGFGGGGGGNTASQSPRALQQNRVVAVPDPRTKSVVVSASRELIDQIAKMVEQLDSDPAMKKNVYVFSVENSDPQAVQEIIQNLFPEQNTSRAGANRSSTRQNNNQLSNRQTQSRNSNGGTSRNTSGFGGSSSGFGGTGGR